MTSANSIEYIIMDLDENVLSVHHTNVLSDPKFENLLEFTPHEEHLIKAYGYDSEGELWEGRLESLEKFLKRTKTIE